MMEVFKNRKWVVFILSAFLLFDLSVNAVQYYNQPFDSDIVESVLPLPYMEPLMEDPLGINTVLNKSKHHNPNRYFAHKGLQETLLFLPGFFQKFSITPIESLYFSFSFAKLFILIILLYQLSVLVTGSWNPFNLKALITIALLCPLFQSYRFELNIGAIDRSLTYAFFYAVPAIYLFFFYLPLALHLLHKRPLKTKWWYVVFQVLLVLPICFSGPLNSPIVLLIGMFVLGYYILPIEQYDIKSIIRKIPKAVLWYVIPISLISIYSLYVGTFNSAADHHPTDFSFFEIVMRLIKGLYIQFFSLSYLFIFILLAVNVYLLLSFTPEILPQVKIIFLAVFLFAVAYYILLPFGGYRGYRPNFIRNDTGLPVILAVFFLVGYTTLRVFGLSGLHSVIKRTYLVLLSFFVLFFSLVDSEVKKLNEGERIGLEILADSKEELIVLSPDNLVFDWNPFYSHERGYFIGLMLQGWSITKEPKLFYYYREKPKK